MSQPTTTREETVAVTPRELTTILGGLRVKGAVGLSLSFRCNDPARYAADRGRITKICRLTGQINPSYEGKKARALGVDKSEVEVAETPWYTPVEGCVGEHNGYQCRKGVVTYDSPKRGTRYVTFYPNKGGSETLWTLDGTPCEREKVADMLKPHRSGGLVPNFRRIEEGNLLGAVITTREGDERVKQTYVVTPS
jgi:hypothetical protein